MQNDIYAGSYAGHRVRYKFLYPDTHLCFGSYLEKTDETEADIQMHPEYFQKCREILGYEDTDSYVECKGLISLTSYYLLKYDCCMFHSAAFAYKGRAWLLAGPSGIGKTTQYLNWNALYPKEITMICGDMPLLSKDSGGHITVHSTAWNGKENIGTKTSAPLGGILFLRQGKENRMEALDTHKSAVPVFQQFRTVKESEEDISSLSSIAECILRTCPVWKYTNLGNDASTELLRNTLRIYCAEKGITG